MKLAYPRGATLVDLARSGVGLGLTAGPVLVLELAWPALLLLGAGAIVFAAFGARALGQRLLGLELDPEGVVVSPGGWRLAWADVRSVTLAYYSVRRDRERGWFELVVRAPAGTLRVDSRLDGFADLARIATAAAGRAGVALDATTVENLAALGEGPTGARAVD